MEILTDKEVEAIARQAVQAGPVSLKHCQLEHNKSESLPPEKLIRSEKLLYAIPTPIF